MEIKLMSTITGFEAGITHLQDPSFFSRLSQSFKFYSFWTWVALLLTTIATFSSIFGRSVIALLFKFKTEKSSISEPLIGFDTDPDDETSSISSESDSDDTPSTSKTNRYLGDEDFRVSGSKNLDPDSRKDRKFVLYTEEEEEEEEWFSGGVVKLWNDLGFGFEKSSGLMSMLDLNRGEILMSLLGVKGQIPAINMPSPAVVVSAGVESVRSAAMRIWDARACGRATAAAVAEWQPRRRRVVGVDSGGVEKVYVREHGGSVVVRDLRNVASPLEEITESDDGLTWFDADVSDGELTEKGGVTRCFNGWSGNCSGAGHGKSFSRTRFCL